MFVNLGIGMPTTTANYIDPKAKIWLHSENGMIGTGPYPVPGKEDPDLINAGKETVTILPGGSFIDSNEAFNLIRGNHLDFTMLGAMQVSTCGDVANWTIPGKLLKGMGGAMDLVSNTRRVYILMSLLDKNGKAKIMNKLTLPATGKNCVDKVITDFGVFRIAHPGHELHIPSAETHPNMILTEVSRDHSVQEILALLDGVNFRISETLECMEDNSSKHNADVSEWEEIEHFFE